ncbi:MAG TPA: glycosyl hydrolase family 18 protein [Candidatus Paceibacterota bacterium]|jgi:spore germination protein YaaH|nr:glycosyl hydrolase family 18 protein [Candidatus Paceibacterota bacterium]
MTKQIYKNIIFAVALFAILGSGSLIAHAADNTTVANTVTNYKISGWIPYWASLAGAKDALTHLDKLDTINPFGYTVNADGSLNDLAQINKQQLLQTETTKAWQDLFTAARSKSINIIPTVTWLNGAQIDQTLSNPILRANHEKELIQLVNQEQFDGLNIDYEQKFAQTKNNFSLFLKELKAQLGKNKVLLCTIEARTPPESYYRVVPANLEYANDYTAIGKYCDQVQILAYDQGRADFVLNGQKAGSPYIPVADKDWVQKVALLAAKEIPKEKITLGAPTYGNEYQVTVSPNWFQAYTRVSSVTPPQALATAAYFGATPSRNKAGEQSFSYLLPTFTNAPNTLAAMLPKLTVPAGTPSGDIIAQKALAFANSTGATTTFNLVWWSDAMAIQDKLDLVRSLGLGGGLAIFKIDGAEDTGVWNLK